MTFESPEEEEATGDASTRRNNAVDSLWEAIERCDGSDAASRQGGAKMRMALTQSQCEARRVGDLRDAMQRRDGYSHNAMRRRDVNLRQSPSARYRKDDVVAYGTRDGWRPHRSRDNIEREVDYPLVDHDPKLFKFDLEPRPTKFDPDPGDSRGNLRCLDISRDDRCSTCSSSSSCDDYDFVYNSNDKNSRNSCSYYKDWSNLGAGATRVQRAASARGQIESKGGKFNDSRGLQNLVGVREVRGEGLSIASGSGARDQFLPVTVPRRYSKTLSGLERRKKKQCILS